jgi:hypothetical protein
MWCWHCCHEIEGESLEMPHKYDEKRRKFYTSGHFCSWSCMKTWAIDRHGITRGGIIVSNIVCMRKQLFGQIGPIPCAPNRYKLKEFGGELTIDEFRRDSLRDSGTKKHIDREDVRSVLVEPQRTESPPATSLPKDGGPVLKLKRNKPLVRSHTSLESALGLVIKPRQLSHEVPANTN